MAKKVLSIVLAVVMLSSAFVVGSFASTDYKKEIDKFVLGNIYYQDMDDAMLEEFIAADPDIIETNLFFWDDDIIARYNDLVATGASTTGAQWEDLYTDMCETWYNKVPQFDDYEPMSYDWYWPLYLQQQKGTVEIDYSTDVAYAKPGDEIEVTVKATTNFWSNYSHFAIMYDKTLVEYKSVDTSFVPDSTWMGDSTAYYGLNADNTVCYIDSYYEKLGNHVDMRKEVWPMAWRDNANGEFDKYEIVIAQYLPNANVDYVPGVMYNDQVVMKAKFVVKDGVTDGTNIQFFGLQNSYRVIDDEDFVELTGDTYRPFWQYRIISQNIERMPFEASDVGFTYTFNNATVTVGEEPTAAPADYDALDAAAGEFDADVADDYTAETWAAYKNAVDAGKALSRDYMEEDQAIVDAAEKAITDAKALLVKNAVVTAAQNGAATIGADAIVDVTVTGKADMLRLTGAGTLTFAREDAEIINNNDGTETWKIKIYAAEETADYTVYAKYANYTENGVSFTVKATVGQDLSIHSITIVDAYPNSANGDTVYLGRNTIIIKTSTDVTKIQFVDTNGKIEDGCTYTYAPNGVGGNACTIEDEDGERTWTISHNFNALGTFAMPIRTRSKTTLFAATGDLLRARVVY